MFEYIAKLLANLSLYTAASASGAASNWLGYQPKEPKQVKELVKK